MSGSPVPDFFFRFAMRRTHESELDHVLAATAATLDILFLWGRDCVNCDIAKREILDSAERFRWAHVRWLHDNVYDDAGMGTRFGLHGIPAFIVFHHARKIGRITAWPGTDAFVATIDRQIALLAARHAADAGG